MFGKRISEYLDFQKGFLVLIAAVGLARLGFSLAGAPNTTVRFLSMNAVVWAGAFYYGVAVHARGFGGYKQLLPLQLFPTLVMQAVSALGIRVTIAGYPNVFTAPEFSFNAQSQWLHLLSHLTVGIVVPPFILWAVSSLVLWATRKTARRPATA
jgi:hypothetical protein